MCSNIDTPSTFSSLKYKILALFLFYPLMTYLKVHFKSQHLKFTFSICNQWFLLIWYPRTVSSALLQLLFMILLCWLNFLALDHLQSNIHDVKLAILTTNTDNILEWLLSVLPLISFMIMLIRLSSLFIPTLQIILILLISGLILAFSITPSDLLVS